LLGKAIFAASSGCPLLAQLRPNGSTPAYAGTYSVPGARKSSFMRTTNRINF
jgi:hypothetical protein